MPGWIFTALPWNRHCKQCVSSAAENCLHIERRTARHIFTASVCVVGVTTGLDLCRDVHSVTECFWREEHIVSAFRVCNLSGSAGLFVFILTDEEL